MSDPTWPTCRSCAARVRWVWTGSAFMPLDPDPRDDGNIVFTGATVTTRRDGRRIPVVRYLAGDTLPGTEPDERYVSHFATCPNADYHRRQEARRG